MDLKQLNSIGYNYVLDMLSPSSVFGRERLKTLPLITDKSALKAELDHVQEAIEILKTNPLSELKHALSLFKDVRRSLTRCKTHDLDRVELFELKQFMQAVHKVKNECGAAIKDTDITFADLSVPLSDLSVGQEGGFYISDAYSKKLADVREEKSRLCKMRDKIEQADFLLKHSRLSALEEEEEIRVCGELSKKMRPFLADMLSAAENAARLDLRIAKAELALRYRLPMPQIGDKISLTDMYNPMIADSIDHDFVPVSIECGRGVTVITGANMGGKTVVLKTVALNCALILRGFFPFARAATVFAADFVELVSGGAVGGLSGFGSEAYQMDRLYKRSKSENGVILFDEFASATNAGEGGKIFNAAVIALNKRQSVSVLTTHFDGAAVSANAHYQVIGLKNAPLPDMERQIKSALQQKNPNGAKEFDPAVIAQYMDYGLVKTDQHSPAPKEAVQICRLLCMDEDILHNL